ncbi:MAG: DUF5009 domain-containing protein [Bacteroidales bacterium]|nr:DUF5009 domain-containing protein [Bacteroidales bacterium]
MMPIPSSQALTPKRIATIDVMRAIIMFLMLFVNDIPGVRDLPHWIGHAETEEDMLGFSDIVFPGFLFCVGMSIPLAIKSRFAKGDSVVGVMRHVLERSLALIVMGLFTLNACKTPLFLLLVALGFFLVWMKWDRGPEVLRGWPSRVLQATGVVLLVCIMLHYDATGEPFRTGWWGILGLIGWAYLASAVLYLLTRARLRYTLYAWAAVVALCVINAQGGVIAEEYFSRNVFLPFWPGGWTHPALVMSGMAASLILGRLVEKGQQSRIFPLFLAMAAVAGAFTLASHHFWIISKNLATPTWLFICLVIFFIATPCIYWLCDVRGKQRWFAIIAPAGTATLTCYVLPFFWYAIKQLLESQILPTEWNHGLIGIAASLLFSLLTIQAARLLIHYRLTLKV